MYLIHKKNKKVILLGELYDAFFYFQQLRLSTKQKLESPYHLINGERLLSVVVGVVSFSANKPLDFHDTIFLVSPSFFKA